MKTSSNTHSSGYATTLLPAWWIRVLGGVLLAVGLILPWWVIKARTQQAARFQADTSQDIGPLRPEMVLLPEGELSTFSISATEITQGQYQRVIGQLPRGECDLPVQGENIPVSCVTWLDAAQFCNRLSAREDLIPCYVIRGDGALVNAACTGYRLPTATVWEYAARAETHQRYAGTDDDDAVCRYANVWNHHTGFACKDGAATDAASKSLAHRP